MTKRILAVILCLAVLLVGCIPAAGQPASEAANTATTPVESTSPSPLPPQPTPTPTPQNPPDPTLAASPPTISSFEVSTPPYLSQGDVLDVTWQASGYDILLCIEYGGANAPYGRPCEHVEQSGTAQVAVLPPEDAASLDGTAYATIALHAFGAGLTESRFESIPFVCDLTWRIPSPPQWCPYFVIADVPASVQQYEHGLLISAESGVAPAPWYIALFDDGTYTDHYTFPASPGLPPPPAELSAAVGEAQPFMIYQACEDSPRQPPYCYITLPDGGTVRYRYDAQTQARTWEAWPR